MPETYSPRAESQKIYPISEIAMIPQWTVQLDRERDVEQFLGYVSGISIQGISIGKEFLSGFRDVIGGRMSRYEDQNKIAENEAVLEMLTEAQKLGANAIIDFTIEDNGPMSGTNRVKAYGIAVKLRDKKISA